MQEKAAHVHIADEIYGYVTRLAQSTREHALVQLGLSPRGALAVCRMAKARAFVYGRDYIVPEDVAAVFCRCVQPSHHAVSQGENHAVDGRADTA